MLTWKPHQEFEPHELKQVVGRSAYSVDWSTRCKMSGWCFLTQRGEDVNSWPMFRMWRKSKRKITGLKSITGEKRTGMRPFSSFSEFPTMQCFSDFVVTLIISFCLISRGFLREQSQVYFARSKQTTKSIADVKMLKWARNLKCFLLRTIVQVVCYLRPMASYNLV